ncbi:MAG: nuclear transport factor 2 family protein [Nitrospirae bacterium]|nr:nuclear transport factor 2 family protein [Nitrospirota bacterium]
MVPNVSGILKPGCSGRILVYFAFMLAVCFNSETVHAYNNGAKQASCSEKVYRQIDKTLTDFSKAYVDRSVDDIVSYYYPASDTTAIGAYSIGQAIGIEEIKKAYLKDSEDIKEVKYFDQEIKAISCSGNIAWLSASAKVGLVIKGETRNINNARETFVLKRTGKKWRFVQTHFSTIAPGPDEKSGETKGETKN